MVQKHFSDRIRKGNHDSERESFRDSNYDNSDADDEELEPGLNVSTVLVSPVEPISVSIDEKSDKKNEDCYNSTKKAKFANIFSYLLKFLLKWSLFFRCLLKLLEILPFDAS